MSTELYQLRFRGAGPVPDARTLERWARRWVRTGEQPAGVKIDVKDWYNPRKSPKSLQTSLQTGRLFFGCPGIVANYHDPTQTLCDYDDSVAPDVDRVFMLARYLRACVDWVLYRRTRKGWHVVIQWKRRFKPIEVIAIQSILGSDPVRERFNLARVMGPDKGRDKRWNLLFERKIRT